MLSLLLLAAVPAAAEVSPGALAAAQSAFRDFDQAAPPGAPLEQLPRLSDPAGRAMLERLFDSEALLAGRPQQGQGTPDLMQWIQLASRAVRNYLTVVQRAPDPAAMQGRLQAELVLATTFLYRAQASLVQELQAAGRFPPPGALTPQQEEGMRRMQLGLSQVIAGMLRMLDEPGFSTENRRRMAEVVATDLPLLRPGLTDEARLRLAAEASRLQAKESEPAVAASFDQMQQALTATP
ncbi:hypothetical protein BKE38_28295 [Pseudoroseomonas deserti]|uniref:DUF2059 domain-containing protein n=1 Tax=Teichococcus deserti TaxID=1817963 RepID=A0A1V2GTS8_9PROT|nr:hypothetical protein BKE38_28295 [Pseudoroseomonas deserti]